MGFTAYAQLCLPQVAEAFRHLGFPAYFRIELSWAKLALSGRFHQYYPRDTQRKAAPRARAKAPPA